MPDIKHEVSIPMGQCAFMIWPEIDAAVNRWAKSYFGPHAHAEGGRDQSDFEVNVRNLLPSDLEKFSALFERYDIDKDYDPADEFETGESQVVLPCIISRGVMQEAIPGEGVHAIGTAIAVYDGVFFMEHSIDGKPLEIAPSAPVRNTEVEVDELVVRLAHEAGYLEAHKKITPPEWDDLCAAIRDAIAQYYEHPSEANPFQIESVAEEILMKRFGPGSPAFLEAQTKFECNCHSEQDLAECLDEIRTEKSGWNYLEVARLWHKPAGCDKTIMVEYQVATLDCRELTENEDVSDWLTAYEVENEDDYDCSNEIATDTVDSNIQLSDLRGVMCNYAIQVGVDLVKDQKPSLAAQISSVEKRYGMAAEKANVSPRQRPANLEK